MRTIGLMQMQQKFINCIETMINAYDLSPIHIYIIHICVLLIKLSSKHIIVRNELVRTNSEINSFETRKHVVSRN